MAVIRKRKYKLADGQPRGLVGRHITPKQLQDWLVRAMRDKSIVQASASMTQDAWEAGLGLDGFVEYIPTGIITINLTVKYMGKKRRV